jgi:hypothetical protein
MMGMQRADMIQTGCRVVVEGRWCPVVDYKPGGAQYVPGQRAGFDTWILIVSVDGVLREVRYKRHEQISVKPPVTAW